MMTDVLNVLPRAKHREVDPPESPTSVGYTHAQHVVLADSSNPFPLESGYNLQFIQVEYETYGTLSPEKDNAILVLHALSGDAHAAGHDADYEKTGRIWRKGKAGWWDDFIGPGKPIDTSQYFVICSNVLGSCYGTTGPTSINPLTGEAYRLTFPLVTVSDWVRLQERLITHLGIEKLLATIGGSLGGQQSLEWSLAFPDRLKGAIILAAAPSLSSQGIAFNVVARRSIITDPDFNRGNYSPDNGPIHGLAAARMIGHITYLSSRAMEKKFGRRIRLRAAESDPTPEYPVLGENAFLENNQYFEVESYLRYQGKSFVERFDANSYLYILHAMDHYDASAWGGGDLLEAARRVQCNSLVVSFTSDWLYTPESCRDWATALSRLGRPVTYVNIESDSGHDAFLLEEEMKVQGVLVRSFLQQLRKMT